MAGLIGRKVGMTQIFLEGGARVPVTVVDVSDNIVLQKKAAESKDGYNAVKLGFEKAVRQEKAGMVRHRGITKPNVGTFEKAGIETPYRHVREFRCTAEDLDHYTVGQEIAASDAFRAEEFVDVTGITKGRGFTGVIKRHGFSMARATHGTHEFFRHGGAIGQSAWPGKVQKGKKMPGQHGNCRVTTQNLKVVEVVAEDNLLLIQGGVPGANGSLVTIKHAVKKARARAQGL